MFLRSDRGHRLSVAQQWTGMRVTVLMAREVHVTLSLVGLVAKC